MTVKDIEKFREDTPHCQSLIHFNNAGAALSPSVVTDTMIEYLNLEQKLGGYEAAIHRQNELEQFYSQAATLLNSSPREIAFTESATQAWNLAFHSIPFESGDKIVTGEAEYASNFLGMLHLAKKLNLEIQVIPNDTHGTIDLNRLEAAMDQKTKLVAITHVPTNNGLVNPAIEIGALLKSSKALYLLDACQSLGQLNVDVEAIGCDFLCGTGRKYLRGPRGTGLLFSNSVTTTHLSPLFVDLHSTRWTHPDRYEIRQDGKRFECWEHNVAGKLGLTKALAYCNAIRLETIEPYISSLAQKLRAALGTIPQVQVLDRGAVQCGIVTFTTPLDPEILQKTLQSHKINISSSYSEYAQLNQKAGSGLSRSSVHYYNTAQEVDAFAARLSQILKSSASR